VAGKRLLNLSDFAEGGYRKAPLAGTDNRGRHV
jgi:hypothetical protein